MIKYTDFFDLLNIDKEPPIAALFMTYGFDAELFEHHILSNFLGVIGNADENELRFRNQIAMKLREVPVTVISDGKQYNGGRTFLYDHITVSKHTFHPKCYILLYQTFLRVIIGSCNITKAGLCYNAETVWYEDIIQDKPASTAGNLKEIIKLITENNNIQDNDAIKEIIKFLNKCKYENEFPKLLSTLNKNSVFTNYFNELNGLKEECNAISILSPFYENDRDKAMEKTLLVEFADKFKTKYPKARIKIYFQATRIEKEKLFRVIAPVNIFEELCSRYKDTELHVIQKEWERDDDEPVPRTLHAKIIMLEFKSGKKLILSGSINFTNNAMRSKVGALRNIEIGVLEYGRFKLSLPQSTKVKINELSYEEQELPETANAPFVESTVLDGSRLIVKLIKEKLVVPFKIEYQNRIIYKAEQAQEIITINPFNLKRSQDLHLICSDYDFYVPIMILRKEEFESEDLQLSFKLEMKDIIDYLAGKFRSISEIERLKRVQRIKDKEIAGGGTVYFRHNLQRYYKAMASLKQGLEMPYYSETAFKSYLSNPIGLKNLISLIVEDFKHGVAGDEETFLFLVEIENVIKNLHYQDDPLEKEFKENELANIMAEPIVIMKKIYKKSTKTIKKQFDVLLNTYGLESEMNYEHTRAHRAI